MTARDLQPQAENGSVDTIEVLSQIASGGFGRVERVRLLDGTVAAPKTFALAANLVDEVDVVKLRKRFVREVSVQSALTPALFIPKS